MITVERQIARRHEFVVKPVQGWPLVVVRAEVQDLRAAPLGVALEAWRRGDGAAGGATGRAKAKLVLRLARRFIPLRGVGKVSYLQSLDVLRAAQRETGAATILITHDLGVVAGTTHRIHVMYAGQIVEKADTPELFANPKMPYTWGLLRSIPKLTGERERALIEALCAEFFAGEGARAVSRTACTSCGVITSC